MWFYENIENPAIQGPLLVKKPKAGQKAAVKEVDPESLIMIESMGFSTKKLKKRLTSVTAMWKEPWTGFSLTWMTQTQTIRCKSTSASKHITAYLRVRSRNGGSTSCMVLSLISVRQFTQGITFVTSTSKESGFTLMMLKLLNLLMHPSERATYTCSLKSD